MKNLYNKLKQRYFLLVNDRNLLIIFLLHLLLIVCHVSHNYISDIQYHWYLRAGGCGLIALLIFFFGRIGLSYGLTVYACCLIYVNTFYNYGSIFFILLAMGANPKKQIPIAVVFLINVIISFSLKHLIVISFIIQLTYAALFYICMKYVFKINTPSKLNLTEDEKKILSELIKGKMQKEIDLFSQQTITHKIKNARERNMCNSTGELVEKFRKELNGN